MRLIYMVAAFAATVFAQTDQCECEAPICPLELKAECLCKNEAATKCYNDNTASGLSCPTPTLRNCETIYPSPTSSTPAPPPAKTSDASCECGWMCTQEWPKSCYCGNASKRDCYEKCGGEEPEYQSCPARDGSSSIMTIAARQFTLATSTPSSKSIVSVPASTIPKASATPTPFTCPCEPAVCVQSWPESCLCENEHKKQCYQNCGGAAPEYQDCTTPPNEPSPKGQMCGGFAGLSCPDGLKCIDDPSDDCGGLENGGADCSGICVAE